ncbi:MULTISPECIES: hypothetical protein [unclassified Arthrobacter]|uniref:hypothetical protein n=1 Tax=unclassified Arthrobacter TaxID=235627 RepID=UPI00288328E5|nr:MULTISPECIES: hypothetical protein [unclassified Arthrobacter]
MARDIGAQMMLAEWLFVETVSDLRRRSKDPGRRSRYELLGIAPLLRKLLLDGSSLVDTVRAARLDVPIHFRIKPWSAPDEPGYDLPYAIRLADSTLVSSADCMALSTVEDFASTRVGMVDGLDLTVRRVVRYYAHVEGGVHFGIPKEDGQQTMSSMAPLLLGNTTGQIEILGHLGQVVVEALTPLCDSILTSPTIIPAIHQPTEGGFYDHHWTSENHAKRRPKLLA